MMLEIPNPDEWSTDSPSAGPDQVPYLAVSLPDGHDTEIALVVYENGSWQLRNTLTDNGVDDLDPRLAVLRGGALGVTWWTPGQGVLFAELSDPTSAVEPVQVSDAAENASAPSVAPGGEIAYQSATPAGTDVVFAVRDGDSWSRTVVAATPYSGPRRDGRIDVRVHSMAGRVWVDWVHAHGLMAYAVRDAAGDWSDVRVLPYAWGGETGESEPWAREMARVAIRAAVFAR